MKTKFFGLVLVLALLVTLGGAIAALGSTAYQGVGLLPSPSHPVTAAAKESQAQQAIIIDHTCTDLGKIPEYWIDQAKAQLRLSYGHTSHGSQPISGMEVLRADPSYGGLYDFNTNGAIVSGTLSLDDYTPSDDLGHDGDTSWAARTRTYLDGPGTGSSRNVVIWSWCGGVSDNTEQGIDAYLSAMSQLEEDYPDVTFVYMTGHLDGSGETGNLNVRNNQIRDYCIANNKVLFDFADIESYDPDGNYYLDRGADDNCDYDGGNWAVEWCVAHPGECSSCSCAHSQSLNCDLKARAFWWMLARLAGWDGITEGGPQKTASTKTVMHGQTVTYTVTIRDLAAPLTATVYLTDEIPTGLIYASGTLTATTGTVTDTDAPTLRWSGVLTPTPAVTVTYAAAVTAITPQVITNSAVIAAPGYQPITRTATITVVQAPGLPDLTPSFKVVSSPYADYGERITYTAVVRNATGPLTDTVHFTDTIMSGLSYVPGTLTATTGTVTDTDAPTLRWSGVLTPTPAVTVTYAAAVTAITPQVITNSAVIAAPGYQPITRTATITVVQAPGLPDLTPSFKVVSSPYADYGERITYTVVVRNAAGPMTDTVHFTDTIMSGLSYVPGTLMATTGTFTDTDTPTLRWSGVLTPTPAVTVTYAATVTHVLSGTATLILPQVITNTAVIAVPGYQTLTRTATVRTNWQGVYLPLVLKVSAP